MTTEKTTVQSIANFQAGQQVICSFHGLGTVEDVVTESVMGQVLTMYKIYFEYNNFRLLAPMSKLKELNIRKLCSKEVANKVFAVFAKPSRPSRGMWSKRAQEYETKIHSGSLLLTAEVVRDLFPNAEDPNRSYSERVIYENALNRVFSEVAVVLKISEAEVEKRAMKILAECRVVVKPEVTQMKDDFEDEDLEIFNAKEAEVAEEEDMLEEEMQEAA